MSKLPRRWASTVLAVLAVGVIELGAPPPGAGSGVCPPPPSTLAGLISPDGAETGPLTEALRPVYGTYAEAAAACWGNVEIAVAGFVASPEGLGGVSAFTIEPLWMVSREHFLSTTDAVDPQAGPVGPFLPVAVPPALEESFALLRGRWVSVSGHFHDDSAGTCAVTSSDPGLGRVPTAEQAITICQTSFVLTTAEAIAGPPTDTESLELARDKSPGGAGFIVAAAAGIALALVLQRHRMAR